MSRKKRPEHSNHERWLVSYADFITLLFAFFVVLYSSSQVDKRKVGKLAVAIQTAFAQMGVFDNGSTRPQVLNPEDPSFTNFRAIQDGHAFDMLDPEHSKSSNAESQLQELPPALRPNMDQTQKDLETTLAREIEAHSVSVTRTQEGIVVSLQELGFFDSGSAALQPNALSILGNFIKVAGPLHSRIRIEGHTDNLPIHNGRFDSNWELSTARATEIAKLFITKYSIVPQRLSASGYAEYYPVASNDTPQGRAANRRVDLVILTSGALSSALPPSDLAADPVTVPAPNSAPDSTTHPATDSTGAPPR